MQTRITARQFDAPSGLRAHVMNEVGALGRVYDGIQDVHVVLKAEPPLAKSAEVAVQVYRHTLTARATAATHEAAVDGCVRQLRRQVLRYKDRLRSKREPGAKA